MEASKQLGIFMMAFFVFNTLHAMDVGEEGVFNEIGVNYTRTPLLLLTQLTDIEEEKKDVSNYACTLFSCLNTIFSSWNVIWQQRETPAVKPTDVKNARINILILPGEMIMAVTEFLSSMDILRLSGVCRKFQQMFDVDFWTKYISKKPQAFSRLVLNGPISPSLHRKAFFSHLWYRENRTSLAARLNHPEAIMIQKYGVYGAYIGSNQYLCPLGIIKYISGEIDHEGTEFFKDAQRKKIEADLEDEMIRRKEKQRDKFGSRMYGGWQVFPFKNLKGRYFREGARS